MEEKILFIKEYTLSREITILGNLLTPNTYLSLSPSVSLKLNDIPEEEKTETNSIPSIFL